MDRQWCVVRGCVALADLHSCRGSVGYTDRCHSSSVKNGAVSISSTFR